MPFKTLKISGIALGLSLMMACNNSKPLSENPESPASPLSEHLVMSTLWYQTSLEAYQLYIQGYELARMRLVENMETRGKSDRSAIIIDIDETVLDNSPYEASLILNNESYDPETWKQWVQRAEAQPLPGAQNFLRFAESEGIHVFYVSNRNVDDKDATIENLQKFEFPYVDEDHVLLQDEGSDKTGRRQRVMEEYDVLLFIGDQLTDFSEMYKTAEKELLREQSMQMEMGRVESSEYTLNQHFILMPNPMYGTFESTIYEGRGLSDSQKRKVRLERLRSAE